MSYQVFSSNLVSTIAKYVLLIPGQWIRLVSGPLEHHGTVHFLLCIASFILKCRFLESMTTQPPPSFLSRTVKTAVMTIATSLVYVLSSQVAEDLLGRIINLVSALQNCVITSVLHIQTLKKLVSNPVRHTTIA